MTQVHKNILCDAIVFILVAMTVVMGFDLFVGQFKKEEDNTLATAILDVSTIRLPDDPSPNIDLKDAQAELAKGPWLAIRHDYFGTNLHEIVKEKQRDKEEASKKQKSLEELKEIEEKSARDLKELKEERTKKEKAVEDVLRKMQEKQESKILAEKMELLQGDARSKLRAILDSTKDPKAKVLLVRKQLQELKQSNPALFNHGAEDISEANMLKMALNTNLDAQGRNVLHNVCAVNFRSRVQSANAVVGLLPYVELVISKGADINAADCDGWTPLCWASWSGMELVADLLISKGAGINVADKKGNTPLMVAALGGHVETVKILLARGANRDAKNQVGKTALDFAREEAANYSHTFNLMPEDAIDERIGERLREVISLLEKASLTVRK